MLSLTEEQKLMLEGKICPYCKQPSKLVDTQSIYGKSYGLAYCCKPCDAWVGVHSGTTVAKGRLANAKLRLVKIETHKYFDIIWQKNVMTRKECYEWLSDNLNIPKEYTHIGMFNLESCKKTIEVCKQLLNDNRRIDLDFGAIPITPYFDLMD